MKTFLSVILGFFLVPGCAGRWHHRYATLVEIDMK